MSFLGSILGADVGDVLTTGVSAATQIFTQQNALQIAQLNLQAQQSQAAATTAAANVNTNNTRFLVTGGLVLAAGVFAIRLLRK